jgi:transposase
VVTAHVVKLACELPEVARRALTLWTCNEIAKTLVRDKVVDSISGETVRRILQSHKLKPWRVHHWLSADVARDANFSQKIDRLCELYTRPFGPHERCLSVDEMTSIQPRPRTAPTLPALPGNQPVKVEHTYKRGGAVNLLAGFDIHTGEVLSVCRPRKRQVEFIELLDQIDQKTPADVTTIYLVCDNVPMHSGKEVQAWLLAHPRFQMVFTPVHCSWLNQVEQWFSIIQRKRLRAPNFKDLKALQQAIEAFVAEWNACCHPFNWTERSFDKIRRKVARLMDEKAMKVAA